MNSGATVSYRFDSWMIIKLLSLSQSLNPIFLKADTISGQISHLSSRPQQYQAPGLSFFFQKYGFVMKKLWLTADERLAGPQPGFVGEKKDCALSTQTTGHGALMLPFAATTPATEYLSNICTKSSGFHHSSQFAYWLSEQTMTTKTRISQTSQTNCLDSPVINRTPKRITNLKN